MKEILKYWYKAMTLRTIIIAVVLYFGFIAVLLTLVINPVKSAYSSTKADIAATEEVYIEMKQLDIQAALNTIKAHIAELEDCRQHFNARLSGMQAFNALIPQLDQFCSQAGLKVIKLEQHPQIDFVPPSYQKRFIDLVVTGSFRNIQQLLIAMDQHPRWLLIENLRILPIKNSDQQQISLKIGVLMEKPL